MAADNFLDYFHANTAKYYCQCHGGFFGINCELSTEQSQIPTISLRPSQVKGQPFPSVQEGSEVGSGLTLDAKVGIGLAVVILFVGLAAMGAAFWYCKRRDDVIVRYVANQRPREREQPTLRVQKSDIVKVMPPPAYQYEDHSEMEEKYSDKKFAL